MLVELLPNMTDFLLPPDRAFAQMLADQPLFVQMFGAIRNEGVMRPLT